MKLSKALQTLAPLTANNKDNSNLLFNTHESSYDIGNEGFQLTFNFFKKLTNFTIKRNSEIIFDLLTNISISNGSQIGYRYGILSSSSKSITIYITPLNMDERSGIYQFNPIFYIEAISDYYPYTQTQQITINGWRYCCLLKGTLITLANGSQKKIEDITYDDELLVWDFDNGCLSSSKPSWIAIPNKANYYYKTKYLNGTQLLTTGKSSTGWGHRAFDMRLNKFRYTYQSIGNDVKTIKGSTKCIASEYIDGECEFYNIITKQHFNLFANGILTSCSMNNLYEIKDMQFIKQSRNVDISKFKDVPQQMIKDLRIAEQPNLNPEYIYNILSQMK